MTTRTRALVWITLALVVVTLGACDLFKPKPGPTPLGPTPTPIPTITPTLEPTGLPPRPVIGYTPVPESAVSPVIIQRSPETGQELAPEGGIQLVFDRAMDASAVEAAFAIQPAVTGKFEWSDARTLLFKPAQPLARGKLYDVMLKQTARAADGAPLRSPYQFRFATAGFLEIGQVMPAPDSTDVETQPRITVIFNRPVVPLTSLGEQAKLPQPLTLDPPAPGRGEWLNTSIYVFRPDKPLSGGATYTARVSGVKDTDGNPMAQDYIWRFTTQPPQVMWVSPYDGAQLTPIETSIQVQFNQPIDTQSVVQAFNLRANGESVSGVFRVISDTLVFTPSQRLPFDAKCALRIAPGVQSAAGGQGMRGEFTSSFGTVPLPRITQTYPADGERAASPYTSFTINFNTRIDPKTVMPNIQMTPPLSPTQVYTSYWDMGFSIYFGALPSTEYVVRIGPDIADPYGNKTSQSLTVRFRTADLPPSVYLNVPDYIGTYNAYAPARLYASYVNLSRLDLKLYRITPDEFLKRYYDLYNYDYTLPDSMLVRAWSLPLEAALNRQAYARIDVAEGGGALEPGLYMLTLTAPGLDQSHWGRRHLLVVSKINLTLKNSAGQALVWATDLQSGQPVSGLNLAFYNSDWQKAGAATTDADGLAAVSTDSQDTRGLVAALSTEPFTAVFDGWNRGISSWEFGLEPAYGQPSAYRVYVYTDRSIYRPGQTVYFRGIVRAEDDARYSLPKGGRVHFVIQGPSEQLVESDLPLNDYGAFSGELKLGDNANLGSYSINGSFIPAEPQPTSSFLYATFQVAAYRPPEFEVLVAPEQPAIVRGVTSTVNVQVKYYSGGPVANAPVNWNVIAEDYDFKPAWGGNYTFRDTDDPWRCWDCWWRRYTPPTQVVLSGSGVTDQDGNLRLEFSDSKFQQVVTGSQRLIVEATAVGADNQYISGRGEIVAHRGGYYIGLAADKYVGKEGEPFAAKLVAVDWRGDNPRLPGKTSTVQVYRREWKNTYIKNEYGGGTWKTEVIDTLIDTQSVTTNDTGEATFSFIPPQGGSYRIVAADSRGEVYPRPRPYGDVRSSMFVWAAGKEYVSWMRENNDRINLIANKVTFTPGETAEILIPSPYQGAHFALVTVERGGILKREVIRITSNSQVYRLPLTADYAPNVYVSVVLIQGAAASSEGLADYKVGIAPLEVKPLAQKLNITLTPDPAQGQPGQEIVYTLRAANAAGQPVQAEFSLDLVDKAVLALMPRQQDAVVEAFYGKRGLGVQTSSGLAISVNRMLQELEMHEPELAGRGAADGYAVSATPVAAAAPPAPGLLAGEEAKSSAAAPPGLDIRQEFADTAYWNASVVTDQDGKAIINIKLPDNLTTWVMRGVGVTLDTRVGEGLVDLVSTKPLLVRPVTPRFFVVGDRAQLAVIVNNNTDAALQATVALSATGVVLSTPAQQQVTLPARGEARLTWNMTVEDVTQVELIFWAVAGQYNDASKPRLTTGPDGSLLVFRYSAPDIVGTAGDLPQAGARTEVIALPPKYDERQGELTVQLDTSLAAAMQDGLKYLEHYEYECAEQTVSRFLPNVLTYRALQELGIRDQELESRLPGLVQQGLDKLYNQQRGDGGWGWWYDSQESNVHLTAYVVFALVKAQQSGFEVRGNVLERGEQFLASKLVGARELSSLATANRQAFVLYVLAEGGQARKTKLSELYENRDKLSHYGRAYLALALWLSDPTDKRIATLLSDLNNAAILSAAGAHWEESAYDWWAMNTDTRSTAIILDALARLDKENQLVPNVVRWLMVTRKGGYWETTQETAWALIALTDWMQASSELQGNYDYAVFLNEKDWASGRAESGKVESKKLTLAVADLLQESNRLTIARGDGTGRLYYTAHLRVFLPVADIQPASRGITVNRRYTLASCADGPKCPDVKEVKLGDVIRVDLTIIAPNDLYYVVVEDPLPAGGEAIDRGLATTSLLDQDPTLRRQPEYGNKPYGNKSYWWDYYWWWWHWYSRSELRDEKVVLFADYLPKGTYEYSYTFRATLPGDYQVIPTVAHEFYFPEVFGRSDGRLLSIGQ